MTLQELFGTLERLATLVFVISSMASLGLRLTLSQIVAPLRHGRLVLRSLLANYVVVPFLAFLLTTIIPLDPSLRAGLILLACAAGAPFLPKLVQLAKGDVALSVGIMVLLILVSIVYIPIVLPWLLPGISVNAIEIGRSLVVLILLPLAIALFIDSRYPELAESLEGIMVQASNTSLIVLFVLLLVLNFQTLIGTIGTGAIFTTILFVAISFAIGYFLAPYPEARSVLGLGTAQRNIAAALVVATGNFGDDPAVLTMIVIGSLLMMVILFPAAGELGRRNRRSELS